MSNNWCNVRLIIVGRRPDVLSFSRLARLRPSSVFEPDMLHGEGADLSSERIQCIETLGPDFAKKVYRFQVLADDGLEHFRRLSRKEGALCFVLVYADPNCDSYGSYFITQGRARRYEQPDRLKQEVMERHGYTADSEEDWRFWEASSELMDLAERHWEDSILKRGGQP